MTRRLEKLEALSEPIINALDSGDDPDIEAELRRAVINASDVATDRVRACGGACIDCSVIGEITGDESFKVCDSLESSGVVVYRERTKERTVHAESGGFY